MSNATGFMKLSHIQTYYIIHSFVSLGRQRSRRKPGDFSSRDRFITVAHLENVTACGNFAVAQRTRRLAGTPNAKGGKTSQLTCGEKVSSVTFRDSCRSGCISRRFGRNARNMTTVKFKRLTLTSNH